jgi:HEAT repeats
VILPTGSLPIAIGNGVPKNIFRQTVMEISRLRSGCLRIRRATAFAGHRRPISWLASAFVAAGFAAGSSSFAQYSASGQPYSAPYTPGNPPVFTQSAPAQSSDQTDEQLLTVGRLLEQEGRYAQAQKIYTELERRRLSAPQQPATGTTNGSYQQQAQYQPAGNYQPQNFYQRPQNYGQTPQNYGQPATGMMPQGASPIAWQGAQMPNQMPMMQMAPQGNIPVYDPNAQMMVTQSQPAAQLPPPAPPSEGYVVDTQTSPPPKTTGISDSQGWRSAIAPLPAAFKAWNSDRPTPYQSAAPAPSPSNTVAEQTLPDLPIAPVAPLNSTANQFPSSFPQNSQVPRFVSPLISSGNGERRPYVRPDQQLAAPPTLRLTPLPKNLENLEAERDSQKQTDAIRIIPGQRALLQLKPEVGGNLVDPRERPASLADDKPPIASNLKPSAPAAIPAPEPRALVRSERVAADAPTRFDLATWVAAPEFREIHTADVIAGLDLLTRPEPKYRGAGAIRIAAAGENARTALPVLRKLLPTEPDRLVRLRIAEALLKLQPNDGVATSCLSELISGRNEPEIRQTAASALAAAAAGRNAIAVASLTEALDDASPQVRAAAATSLGLFGRNAADSVSRLENTALNDIPTVRQAATLALSSIRGIPTDQSAAPRRDSASLINPQIGGQLTSEAAPTGRATLVDRQPPRRGTDAAVSERDAANSQPKLFPADRTNGSRVLAPAAGSWDDEAVPTSATAPEAPTKALLPAAAPAFQPLQINLAPPPTPAAPAAADDAPAFLLQSEAGASKASSKP